MKKQSWLLLAFLIFSTLLFYAVYFLYLSRQEIRMACINENCFDIEIADDPEEREQGLSNKISLDENKGMLFIFQNEAKHAFWMKDTWIYLDIIWINEGRRIVDIKKNAVPCSEYCPSLVPTSAARYVLEINAGLAERYGFDIGDAVVFKK